MTIEYEQLNGMSAVPGSHKARPEDVAETLTNPARFPTGTFAVTSPALYTHRITAP